MYSPQRIGVLVITGLVLAFMTPANAQYGQRVARGVWGGLHINMVVGARSATVEYDCAHGTIDGRPGFDKLQIVDGTFTGPDYLVDIQIAISGNERVGGGVV